MDLIWIKLWSSYTLLCLVFKWLALFSEQHSKQIEADALDLSFLARLKLHA